MELHFHGAAREVTGSCHRVVCGDVQLLVDCGMFQRGAALPAANAEPFGFDAAAIDLVLLTHAHLDHCGRLPLLVRRGFRGEIVATAPTRELARLVMLDAASIQEEDAERLARSRARQGAKEADAEPLYTVLDALDAIERFGRTAGYGRPLELAPGVRATFHDAGHILGSASVELHLEHGDTRRRLLFSGDLGNPGRALLRPAPAPPAAEIVVMEATYGDRRHRPFAASVEELFEVIAQTFERGGNVLIPSFALERTQELLFTLRQGIERGLLPRATPVFLDSPMAISATRIFRRHPHAYGREAAALFARGRDPFHLPGLRFTRERAQSRTINEIRAGAIIMAGSGMCTGGRILHHLKHNLWRAECSVVFVGFAAEGTLARAIIDGAEAVEILGESIPVRAAVHTINGFSAHADRDALLAWHAASGPSETALVHAEPDVMERFAAALRTGGTRVRTPRRGERWVL